MQTNATKEELQKALDRVNKRYDGNVTFDRFDVQGNKVRFTLKVKDCHGPGHSCGQSLNKSGKRHALGGACWHAHGHFFEAVLKVRPDAWIVSGFRVGPPIRITAKGGNWTNWTRGRTMMSELCECHGD
jgi:hypothetical protein